MQKITALLLASLIVSAPSYAESTSEVMMASDVKWGYLNPLRGDKSPKAADLWGDRTKDVATGMLIEFNQDFSSPAHIHNITYRGVVIKGLLHNDDPSATKTWLPAGSFWTQPAGEAHITAAHDKTNLAYIEIDSGPYLVQPTSEAFDNGERAINVDESNMVWLDASEMKWIASRKGKNSPKVAYLWGAIEKGAINGRLVKLPAEFTGTLTSDAETFRAVVIQGDLHYQNKNNVKVLQPGSYFGSTGEFNHLVSTKKKGETIMYVRTNGYLNISEK